VVPESAGAPRVLRLKRARNAGHAAVGISRDTLIRLIDFPELPLRIHTRDTIKAGRTALLVRGEFPIGGRMVSVAYKRIERRNGWKVLSAWLFGNRTLKTFRMGRTLLRLGIPTAAPLLAVVPRWYRPGNASYLACEWLSQGRNLTQYASRLSELSPRTSQRRLHAAATALGELLGKLHVHRISHRDLKAGNLLLVDKPSSVEAYVIDLDGARRYVWLPRFRRLRDVSRLALAMLSYAAVTNATRLRFLLAYRHRLGKQPGGWKADWRRLDALVEGRRLKKLSPGEPSP
jgi:tRNA A-37 threonylcarbamoyl transferase component Bud32